MCRDCETPFFSAPRRGPISTFCSRQCRRHFHGASAKAYAEKRRAMMAEVPYERIDRDLVFERDEWVCGLCDQPVCRTLEYPDPMSKSLDHIIPIIRGGSHTYGNVQLAHLCCNIKASSKRQQYELAA